jgi:DNA-directed RNA polymerase subunit L
MSSRSTTDLSKLNADIAETERRHKADSERLAGIEAATKPNVAWKLKFDPVHFTKHELWNTEVVMTLGGKVGDTPVDEIIPSMIKHTIIGRIVTYGIGYGCIKISENSSCFDEHWLFRRFCQLPVPGIAPEIMVLDPAYYPYVKGDCGTLGAPTHTSGGQEIKWLRHPNDRKEIRMSLIVEHTDDSMRNVTTSDLKCYLNDKEVQIYDPKYPILILKLRKNEKISAQLMPVLGFGDLQNTWSPVSNSFVTGEVGATILTVRSYGQMTEQELIKRACKLISLRMRRYIRLLAPMVEAYSTSTVLDFTFNNEGAELGELLTYLLSLSPDVAYQSYFQKHPLEPVILLHLKTAGKNPVKVLMSSMATARDMYADLGEQSSKIPDKPKRISADLDSVLRK